MITQIKAELRKIFTVRSTYIIMLLTLVLLIIFGFIISGYNLNAAGLKDPTAFAGDITGAVGFVSVFAGLIAVLLFAHEYRYNTIMYTLTLSNKRSKVVAAKMLVITVLALVFTTVVGTLSPLFSLAGASLHHLHFGPQTIHYWDIIWRNLYFGWGYAMAGLLIAALVRNQIGAIICFFVVPGTVESLLSLLLKKNSLYLPFTALKSVIVPSAVAQFVDAAKVNTNREALIFLAYLVVGWIIGWVLFLRRDAN